MTRCWLTFALLVVVAAAPHTAQDPAEWDTVLHEARGQTVYWHAWAGSSRINDYIQWVGREVRQRFEVNVEHVKLADTADAVSRVLAEKSAGRDTAGAVDLLWLNGENFTAMKTEGLLFGPWAESIPNWRYVDVETIPAVTSDFTVPTDGFEAAFGLAKMVFYYDASRVTMPPRTMPELLIWTRQHPGRFTYPQPPDFLGSTFLKQVLYELTLDPNVVLSPVDDATYDDVTRPLWEFLVELTPNLWRRGAAYPQSGPRQNQLMADSEIDLAISFNPNEVPSAIANYELPDTVRAYVPDTGSISNASFVAIPYNARAKAAAMVVANFLLSPTAQAHKQDPLVWGSDTVLALHKLPPGDRARFNNSSPHRALGFLELGASLPEPHPSWVTRLEQEWVARFGVAR
ncbi:MAG: ABC transporter substrate-binding protein [Acidobacteriota bacterium]|nr:ABC transporter substrate-binding protein [Acidobacteriota bacterium]